MPADGRRTRWLVTVTGPRPPGRHVRLFGCSPARRAGARMEQVSSASAWSWASSSLVTRARTRELSRPRRGARVRWSSRRRRPRPARDVVRHRHGARPARGPARSRASRRSRAAARTSTASPPSRYLSPFRAAGPRCAYGPLKRSCRRGRGASASTRRSAPTCTGGEAAHLVAVDSTLIRARSSSCSRRAPARERWPRSRQAMAGADFEQSRAAAALLGSRRPRADEVRSPAPHPRRRTLSPCAASATSPRWSAAASPVIGAWCAIGARPPAANTLGSFDGRLTGG